MPVEVVEQRTVGPTLGDAAIRASMTAAIVGATLTILYMVAYYRLLGVPAAVALLLYGPLVLRRAARHRRPSPIPTPRRSWPPGLLFIYASGAVRGFGITLSIGVVVSMLSALVVTRALAELVLRSRRLGARPRLLGLDVGGRLRSWLAEHGPDLMARRRVWFSVSAAAMLLAGAGIATRGAMTWGCSSSARARANRTRCRLWSCGSTITLENHHFFVRMGNSTRQFPIGAAIEYIRRHFR